MQRRLTITLDLPLVFLALVMLICHVTALYVVKPRFASDALERIQEFHPANKAIKIQMPKVRTLGQKDGSKKNNVLVTQKTAKQFDKSKPIDPFKAAASMNKPFRPTRRSNPTKSAGEYKQPSARPGSAAATKVNSTTLERLSSTSRSVQEVAQSTTQVAGQATIANSPILSKSNVNMQVEVPEGVAADELNEYELMFYGFQKRMMEKYLGSIMLQVREYERKFPHKSLIPSGRHIMTGRVTFDSSGNIKQIKMVRWTQAQGLQSLFEDVLKSMDSVPNPPKKLWNKEGDFVVFYNLTVNNG